MTLFDADFRRRCAYLDETARRSWGQRFLGRRLDRRCAGGAEFVGHSDYTSGDDIRAVDWHICARLDELVTRQFRGSLDRTVYLIVDVSPGMRLGQPRKFDAARKLAGALGYMALANQDALGVVAASDRITADLPPIRGVNTAHQLFRFLDQLEVSSSGADLQAVTESFLQKRTRRGITVVISDLFDSRGFENAIDLLATRGFEPFLLQIVAREEEHPNLRGGVTLMDANTNKARRAYLEAIDSQNYAQVFTEFRAACRRYCARRSIGIVQTRNDIGFEQAVLQVIRTTTSRMYASA